MRGNLPAAIGHIGHLARGRFGRFKCRSEKDYLFSRPMARLIVESEIGGPSGPHKSVCVHPRPKFPWVCPRARIRGKAFRSRRFAASNKGDSLPDSFGADLRESRSLIWPRAIRN